MQSPHSLPSSSTTPAQPQHYREKRRRRTLRRRFKKWVGSSRRLTTFIVVFILVVSAILIGIFIAYANPAIPGRRRSSLDAPRIAASSTSIAGSLWSGGAIGV